MKYISEVIDSDDDSDDAIGSFEGYVVLKKETNWKIYLEKEISSPEVLKFLINKIENSTIDSIAILKNIEVNEDHRGNGSGGELMDLFFEKASNECAEMYMLVADNGESQKPGFNLVNWYESYGFEVIHPQDDVTLMIWDVQNKLSLDNKDLQKQLAEHLTASANKSKLVI